MVCRKLRAPDLVDMPLPPCVPTGLSPHRCGAAPRPHPCASSFCPVPSSAHHYDSVFAAVVAAARRRHATTAARLALSSRVAMLPPLALAVSSPLTSPPSSPPPSPSSPSSSPPSSSRPRFPLPAASPLIAVSLPASSPSPLVRCHAAARRGIDRAASALSIMAVLTGAPYYVSDQVLSHWLRRRNSLRPVRYRRRRNSHTSGKKPLKTVVY